MTDNFHNFSAALPNEVSFSWQGPGTGFGAPTYLDININSGTVLDGQHDAWCIDTDREIFGAQKGRVFSSYEELPSEIVGPGNIEKPENLDSLNWMINQGFVGTELFDSDGNSLGTVTYGDVQRAIWHILDDVNITDGLGSFSEERAQIIADLALTQGDGFVPGFGQKLAVIITPDTTDDGVFNPDRQFIIAEVELSKLGNFVFEDSNANGIQDQGEVGINGVTVNLLSDVDGDGEIEAHEVIHTTTTDENGEYEFTVVAGDYKVQFEQPEGFSEVSPRQQAGDVTVDSDGLISDVVTLAPGDYNPTIDAGFYNDVQPAGLGDFVFEDINGNGIQDDGEAGVEGVLVKLQNPDGSPVIGADGNPTITTTAADGSYSFTGLNPGEYKVMFVAPDGFEFTAQNAGDDALDSDANPSNGMTQTVTLNSGDFDGTLDAGLIQPAGLGDFVFEDINGNGIQDDGEAGVEGVLVKLQNPDGSPVIGADGNPTTTTTAADGSYSFTGLNPGEYKVMFVAPDGFEFTAQNAGDDALDSDANPSNGMTQTVTLNSGDFDGTLDAGLIRLIPDIDIKKLVNGHDANTEAEAVEITPGDDAIFTYEVTNTGNVSFAAHEVIVTDDNGTPNQTRDDFNPHQVLANDFNVGDTNYNNSLDAGETWLYTKTLTAEDLSTTTTTTVNHIIDFDSDGSGNPLSAGTVIDNEYANLGLTISATGGSNQAMIFDSAHPTGGDYDLATSDEGNILIISEDGDASDADDNAHGGTITFTLDNAVNVNTISFVDIEESGGKVFTTDVDGNVTTTHIPAPGDNSLQTLTINDDNVVEIEVELAGSGAISGLDLDKIETTTNPGIYTNIGTVTAGTEYDYDLANYVNPDPNPGIDIEKFTNGVDADTPDLAVEIAPGDTVTWTYEVTNTGNVSFAKNDIVVTDDQEGVINHIIYQGDGDHILAPGETWIYQETGIAENLTNSGDTTTTFDFSGYSELDGYDGNIRTFSAGDISVKTSAFSRTEHGVWSEAFLGSFTGGLGVTDNSEGDGSNGLHRVDNVHHNNYVLFEFSESVVVDSAFLDYVGDDSDITYWVGTVDNSYNNHNSLSDSFLNSLEFTEDNYTSSSDSRWADINNGEVAGNVLVIAAATSDHTPEDRFKIEKLEVQQVESDIYQNVGTVHAPGATDADTSHYVNSDVQPNQGSLLFSLYYSETLGGVTFQSEDIVEYNQTDQTYSKFFDGSDVGLEHAKIDAFEVISDNEILISFQDAEYIDGVGHVDDSDIVKFTATSLGKVTRGHFDLYFDGSDVGLTEDSEDIDGLGVDPVTGELLISTRGNVEVSGGIHRQDEDILSFNPHSLGSHTSGSWSVYFDGSDVGLNDSGEDVDAIGLKSDELLLSTSGDYAVSGVSGKDTDILAFDPISTGVQTSGTFGNVFNEVNGYGNDITGVDYLV